MSTFVAAMTVMANVDTALDLRLRLPVLADAGALAAAVQASLAEVSAWMDWCGPGYDPASAASWIEATLAARERGEAFEFLMVDAGGDVLGCCGLNGVDAVNRRANLGYWVRSDVTKRGVARAAVRQLLDFAFTVTALERLEILVAVGNAPSLAVAAAIGANREGLQERRLRIHGVFHDAVSFAVLRPAALA